MMMMSDDGTGLGLFICWMFLERASVCEYPLSFTFGRLSVPPFPFLFSGCVRAVVVVPELHEYV